ncbi:unnamed protein product [Acanthoscelides obtectus]|uniref:PiggyBac transposable element-derived protein domain-containing protein n=1 Tax=Acanthoscelides obtectus TaxID=200917 RepID=A0A9P0JQY3_ACAOB|nr:unnamed protein product [Acanthoscelides obtectus]CAK1671250.1 hypothetical protein AOBTE_LOCUS28185 [Acanthoscelides obtectus]
MHFDGAIDASTGEAQNPEMVTFYNMTKVEVDLLDQLCQKNNVQRSTRQWPMVLFYDFLNIAAINSFCIYRHHCAASTTNAKRAEFLENLSWALIKPQIERRAKIETLPRELRRRAKLLVGIQEETMQQYNKTGSRGRCYQCGRQRNKMSRKWCYKCNDWVCVYHLKNICTSCVQSQ